MLTSFTLVGPLGLPWWVPLAGIPVIALAGAGLRRLALRKGARAVARAGRAAQPRAAAASWSASCSWPSCAQILRNWLLLHAVGVDASLLDAIAVLIAVVTLGQLPVGPSVGAASAVLILGHDGVAAVAAAGVLLTATGTIGGLGFAAWAGLDRLGAAWWGRPPAVLAAPAPTGRAAP